MQHAILHGEFELTIDDKNRLLVPSEIRKSIHPERDGQRLFVTIGVNKKPWLYPEKYYEALVSSAENDITPDDDALAFDQIYFAMASRVEMDGQGRIVIPEKTLRRAGLGREVTIIGARDHLEIWDRAEWEAKFAENLGRMKELAVRAKKLRKPSPPTPPAPLAEDK